MLRFCEFCDSGGDRVTGIRGIKTDEEGENATVVPEGLGPESAIFLGLQGVRDYVTA